MAKLRGLLFILAVLAAFPAAASFHTFKLVQVYSNGDGTIQFIQLQEQSGANGQEFLAGKSLTSTQGTTTNTLVFNHNLDSGNTANASVLVATSAFAAFSGITPDYIIPAGFLFTNNGTISYAGGFDVWVYSGATVVPTDGFNALNRDGTTGSNKSTNFEGQMSTINAAPPTATVIEYHHAVFDHYFITPVAAEIALLDAHAPPFQDWSRTGFTFNVYINAGAPVSSVAICRFFNTSFAPKSSHFYAPHGGVCEDTLRLFPDWGLEDDKLFNMMMPDATGACPAGTIPVYRLYNGGMGGAPNHRFVTSLAERQKMIDLMYLPEGNGIGVGMCAPS
jgi:hypothetical protein